MAVEKRKLSDSDYQELREKFSSPDGNYNLLRGDVQGVRGLSGVWDGDFVRERYLEATDKMISILDGSSEERYIEDPDNPEESRTKPDVVIWLDKSARPVPWFVDAFWDRYAKAEVDRPQDEFLNIDRENWFVRQGHKRIDASTRLGPADFDVENVSDEDIARIRAIFTIGEIDRDNWEEHVWELPTRLDDKNVFIVDEVKNKGGTLAIAHKLIKRAIPSATVSGDYFWRAGSYALGGDASQIQMESAPVWYSATDSYGRGVGEISKAYQEHAYETDPTPENFKRLLGWIVLSAPHFNPVDFSPIEDRKAKQLAQDIAYLSYDNNLWRPAAERPDSSARAIVEEQGMDWAQFGPYIRRRSEENSFNKRAR